MNHYTSETLANNFIIKFIFLILLWVISLIIDSLIFCYIAALFGFFTSFFYLLNFFNGKLNPMKFLQISSIFLVLIANLTWLIAGYSGFSYYGTDLFSLLESQLSFSHVYYLYAIIYVLIFSQILFILSLNKKLIDIENIIYEKLLKINYININFVIGITIIIIALEFFLLDSGFIMIRHYSVYVENLEGLRGVIPFYVKYLDFLFYYHIAITGFLLFKYRENKGNLKLIVITISILMLILIFFSKGRGQFTFFFVQLLFWYCFFNKGLPSYRKLLPIMIIIMPLIFYANIFNNFARASKTTIDPEVLTLEKKNLISTIFELIEIFNERNLFEHETSKTTANLSTRTLLAKPLAMSMELPMSEKEFLLGKIIFNTLVWTIPRIIFPEKINFLKQETLIETTFNYNLKDSANSLYLYSYADFGYFGLLIYPILLFLYWKLMATLIFNREFSPLILLYFASSAFTQFITLSQLGLLALTGSFRDMMILTILIVIFLKLKGKSFIASQKK